MANKNLERQSQFIDILSMDDDIASTGSFTTMSMLCGDMMRSMVMDTPFTMSYFAKGKMKTIDDFEDAEVMLATRDFHGCPFNLLGNKENDELMDGTKASSTLYFKPIDDQKISELIGNTISGNIFQVPFRHLLSNIRICQFKNLPTLTNDLYLPELAEDKFFVEPAYGMGDCDKETLKDDWEIFIEQDKLSVYNVANPDFYYDVMVLIVKTKKGKLVDIMLFTNI